MKLACFKPIFWGTALSLLLSACGEKSGPRLVPQDEFNNLLERLASPASLSLAVLGSEVNSQLVYQLQLRLQNDPLPSGRKFSEVFGDQLLVTVQSQDWIVSLDTPSESYRAQIPLSSPEVATIQISTLNSELISSVEVPVSLPGASLLNRDLTDRNFFRCGNNEIAWSNIDPNANSNEMLIIFEDPTLTRVKEISHPDDLLFEASQQTAWDSIFDILFTEEQKQNAQQGLELLVANLSIVRIQPTTSVNIQFREVFALSIGVSASDKFPVNLFYETECL